MISNDYHHMQSEEDLMRHFHRLEHDIDKYNLPPDTIEWHRHALVYSAEKLGFDTQKIYFVDGILRYKITRVTEGLTVSPGRIIFYSDGYPLERFFDPELRAQDAEGPSLDELAEDVIKATQDLADAYEEQYRKSLEQLTENEEK